MDVTTINNFFMLSIFNNIPNNVSFKEYFLNGASQRFHVISINKYKKLKVHACA